ncbi:leader peptidase (signal peptidase I), serine protease [Luminiphilus syltensis NOR5-1B]|uniref:Signal peptidase I n=1 Tax=Luminiphilus syltensis NOR5-1B TaxID=565045 RepID=B8KRG6_9GAMM|nr:signal peptidase I [Luminiphilus syltensis]EED35316.1 leader peptidase (signal peptidase I), serine protease [Luminiphilus syltensis NOR5-1B]
MNIDFPLILVILVFGSGAIWLADSVFAARSRRAKVKQLGEKYPQWQQAGSADSIQFAEAVRQEAAEPVIVEYAKSFFPVLAAVFILRSFIYEPFQIPSSSMEPTLDVGDYILVDKFSYGLRLPVIRNKVIPIGEPARGDVMVFFPPHQNSTYYIKRVIGIPGDRVEYSDKQLSVNGDPLPLEWLGESAGGVTLNVGNETVDGDDHLMQVDDRRPARDFSIVVKPGHYFMMGDNRDNSSDSRVWGQVPEKDIVGKAVAIWMHWESFFSIPSFDRTGAID